jgi:hypothetical protein
VTGDQRLASLVIVCLFTTIITIAALLFVNAQATAQAERDCVKYNGTVNTDYGKTSCSFEH